MLAPRHLPLLGTFVQVCRDGSFTKAARTLSTSKSVVSAHLRALEDALGARLLERTTRRVALTQIGRDVLAVAERIVSATVEVANIAEASRDVPTGVLRVGGPVELGVSLVAPAIARLRAKFSGLRAELVLTDDKMDPIAHRLDAMVSVNVAQDSTFASTQLGSDVEVIVAAPDLARRWHTAAQPRDLTEAPWVVHSAVPTGPKYQWRNTRGTVQWITFPEVAIAANTSAAVRSLVAESAGVAVIPAPLVAEDIRLGRMVRILPDWRGRTVRVHVCLPSNSHQPTRVTLFLVELEAVFEARYPMARAARRGSTSQRAGKK
jgi:DNA-binding transcriptional LysR family regulator